MGRIERWFGWWFVQILVRPDWKLWRISNSFSVWILVRKRDSVQILWWLTFCRARSHLFSGLVNVAAWRSCLVCLALVNLHIWCLFAYFATWGHRHDQSYYHSYPLQSQYWYFITRVAGKCAYGQLTQTHIHLLYVCFDCIFAMTVIQLYVLNACYSQDHSMHN